MRALCADYCSCVLQLNNREVQQACCRAFRSDPVFADFVERAPHLVSGPTKRVELCALAQHAFRSGLVL